MSSSPRCPALVSGSSHCRRSSSERGRSHSSAASHARWWRCGLPRCPPHPCGVWTGWWCDLLGKRALDQCHEQEIDQRGRRKKQKQMQKRRKTKRSFHGPVCDSSKAWCQQQTRWVKNRTSSSGRGTWNKKPQQEDSVFVLVTEDNTDQS